MRKRGKLEEASTAYHQEPHIIPKLVIRFVLSQITKLQFSRRKDNLF